MKRFLLIFAIINAIFGLPTDQDKNSVEYSNDKTIAEWIKELEEEKDKDRQPHDNFSDLLHDMDMECLKYKIKYPENAQKYATEDLIKIFFPIGIVKCQMGMTEGEAYDKAYKIFIDKYTRDKSSEYRDCYAWELQKMNPTSKLVENFNANALNYTSTECEYNMDNRGIEDFIEGLQEQFGSIASFSCENFTADDLKKIGITAIVLGFEEDEKLKSEESEKLKTKLVAKINGTFECILNAL